MTEQERITLLAAEFGISRDSMAVACAIPNRLRLGCTLAQHRQIGFIDAIVNARGGNQRLNNLDDIEQIEMRRDAAKVRDWQENRVIIRQFNSKTFRRSPIAHLAIGFGE